MSPLALAVVGERAVRRVQDDLVAGVASPFNTADDTSFDAALSSCLQTELHPLLGHDRFQAMTHVERLVHVTPVSLALGLDEREDRGHGEEPILHEPQPSRSTGSTELADLGLTATGAVDETMDVSNRHVLEQEPNERRVGARGTQERLSDREPLVAEESALQHESAAVVQVEVAVGCM